MPRFSLSLPAVGHPIHKGLSLLPLLVLGVAAAQGQVATTTQLTVATPSVAAGAPTLLTATVTDAASHSVHLGTVTFFDGARTLGSAQIVSGTSGAYAQGTANLKTASFASGANSITAVFSGTKTNAKSTSSAKTVTVTGKYKTAATLNGTVTGDEFTLTTGLTAFGTPLPTGDLGFVHVSNGSTIHTKPLSDAKWTSGFVIGNPVQLENDYGEGAILVAGDFNNDGALDLVDARLSIALGNGDGTFQRPVLEAFDPSPYCMRAGDFNNDGRLDLVISSDRSIYILLGNGDGTFRSPSSFGSIRNVIDGDLADFNGDGNLDLVYTEDGFGTVVVFLGNGDGTFQTQQNYSAGAEGTLVRAGDLNGDGAPDLIIQFDDAWGVLLNKGDGTFLPVQKQGDPGYAGPNLTLGDVNGDGKLDLVSVDGDPGLVVVSLGNGDGSFRHSKSFSIGPHDYISSVQPVLLDINQDGKLDVAVAVSNASPSLLPGVRTLLGNGDGTFQDALPYLQNYSGAGVLLTGDFDGDGKPDLVTAQASPRQSTIGQVVLLNEKTASVSFTKDGLGAGTTTVAASYSGDANFLPTVSNSLPLQQADVNYNAGFPSSSGLDLNGGATLAGGALELTNGAQNQATSVYSATPVGTRQFATDFTFQILNPAGNGFTFTLQNSGPNAVGASGAGLGYEGIKKSVAIKFDFNTYSISSTGLYLNGALPANATRGLPSTIDFKSGHPLNAHITYNGTELKLTVTDTVTLATWSTGWAVNIPAVAGSSAYAGFTAGTSASTSTQKITAWRYLAGTPPPNFPAGVGDLMNLNVSGNANLYAGDMWELQLTDGGSREAGSVFYAPPQNVQAFTSDFTFFLSEADADGFTFTLQNDGPYALGSIGGGLGYRGINKSVAVKFDLFNNDGEGKNSTGLYTGGAAPELPAIDLTPSGLNLHNQQDTLAGGYHVGYHPFGVHITYDGTNLTMTITDLYYLNYATPSSLVTFSHSWPVDIPAAVGGNTAYVGFTAGTGGKVSEPIITSWTYLPGMP